MMMPWNRAKRWTAYEGKTDANDGTPHRSFHSIKGVFLAIHPLNVIFMAEYEWNQICLCTTSPKPCILGLDAAHHFSTHHRPRSSWWVCSLYCPPFLLSSLLLVSWNTVLNNLILKMPHVELPQAEFKVSCAEKSCAMLHSRQIDCRSQYSLPLQPGGNVGRH